MKNLKKAKKGINSYFEIDFNCSKKRNDRIENDLTCTQSNENLIKALKSKLIDELMLHIKIS